MKVSIDPRLGCIQQEYIQDQKRKDIIIIKQEEVSKKETQQINKP